MMLLNNELDKDFQAMISPLYILEYIYCLPKYDINQAFVTPNGTRRRIHCLFGVLVVILMNIINIFTATFINGHTITETLFKVYLADTVFYGGAGVLVCAMNVTQSEKTVRLILKMQSAYRTLHCDGGLREFRLYNWVFISSVFLSYLLYNLIYVFFNIFELPHLVYDMIIFYFDVNIIVAIRLVTFLDYELILWRKQLYRFLNTCSKTNHEQLMKYFIHLGFEERSLFKAYSDIIEAFRLCSNIFGMSILVLVLEGFGHPLIYVQLLIDVGKSSQDSPFVPKLIFLVSLVWIVKTYTLISWLCAACQKFYLAVAEVEAASAAIRAEDGCLVYAHRLCKNVRRLGASAGARRPLRAGNVLAVDAATPLRLLALLGTYTVVLLQFAFL